MVYIEYFFTTCKWSLVIFVLEPFFLVCFPPPMTYRVLTFRFSAAVQMKRMSQGFSMQIYVVVSDMFYFNLFFGERWSNLTKFQLVWTEMEWWDDQPQGHHKNHHWPCPSFLSSSTPGPVVYDPSCHDVASVNLVLRSSINDKCGWISPGAKWQEHKCSVEMRSVEWNSRTSCFFFKEANKQMCFVYLLVMGFKDF